MENKEKKSNKVKQQIYYSDSESDNSDSESDSSSTTSSGSSELIDIKKYPKNILSYKIKNMEHMFSKILKSKSNTKDHLDQLSRDQLITIKSIFKTVKQLKHIRSKNNRHYLPKTTILAFKKCNSQIENLLLSKNKCQLKSSIDTIGEIDNYKSFKDILLGNKDLYSIQKQLNIKARNKIFKK